MERNEKNLFFDERFDAQLNTFWNHKTASKFRNVCTSTEKCTFFEFSTDTRFIKLIWIAEKTLSSRQLQE